MREYYSGFAGNSSPDPATAVVPMPLIARNIEAEIRDILSVSRACAILGPRQSGKSTLARELQAAGLLPHYFSLDDDAIRAAALTDPSGFVGDLPRPAIIDEVQRAPALLLAIKQVLDNDPQLSGQFLLTGSANLLANRHIADALPGRVEYVNLWPLSQDELAGRRASLIDTLLAGQPPKARADAPGRAAYADRVIAGGFPEARMRGTSRQRARYFDSYVRSVVHRDLPDVGAIRTAPAHVEQLLHLLAARSTGMANYAGLARELGIDQKTVKAYVDLLIQLFLVYRLQPWSQNLGARQVKTPKLMLSDSGLASALIGVDEQRFAAPDQGKVAGMLLETFVTMEIVKQRTWASTATRIFFYRDREGREVDVLLESSSGDVAGIEVKAAAGADRDDARGLRLLRDKLGDRFKAGIVAYTGQHTVRLDDRIWAVPIAALWGGDPTT